MTLQRILEFYTDQYSKDKQTTEELLKRVSDKAHETNAYLKKKFNLMSLLTIFFLFCQASPPNTLNLSFVDIPYSPLLLLVLSALYSYQLMSWSFAVIDDTTITYIIHNKRDITNANEDKTLLHFIEAPLSIYYSEDLMQAHFPEMGCLNKLGWKLKNIISISTLIILYVFAIYMPVVYLSKTNDFHILQVILLPAIAIQLLTSFLNLIRGYKISKQWQ